MNASSAPSASPPSLTALHRLADAARRTLTATLWEKHRRVKARLKHQLEKVHASDHGEAAADRGAADGRAPATRRYESAEEVAAMDRYANARQGWERYQFDNGKQVEDEDPLGACRRLDPIQLTVPPCDAPGARCPEGRWARSKGVWNGRALPPCVGGCCGNAGTSLFCQWRVREWTRWVGYVFFRRRLPSGCLRPRATYKRRGGGGADAPRPAPSRGSTRLAGVSTRPTCRLPTRGAPPALPQGSST